MSAMHNVRKLLMGALVGLVPTAAHAGAQIFIVNMDGPGEGFNDATPAAPVGGNPGTTLGQQRQIAFQYAADIWGATLDSAVPIYIRASFDPLTCVPGRVVLGSAGARQAFRDFPGAELPLTWYPVALANKLAGEDLSPSAPGGNGDDITARFNSNLDSVACGQGGWYYGLDTNHGTRNNLVTVLLHEFGHGLGHATFADNATGALFAGLPDTYNTYLFDAKLQKFWPEMTNAERAASAITPRLVVWDGLNVTQRVPSFLARGMPYLYVTAPAGVAGRYDVGPASFGAPLTAAGLAGDVVVGLDAANAAGPSTTDACTPLTNAVAGKIVLVDRGTCAFTIKAANVQAAGGIAMLAADNVAGGPPPGLGGADPAITIQAVRLTQDVGAALKAATGVQARLALDTTAYAGADAFGRVMVNTPNPLVPGSSVSHWDPVTSPNTLMEPAINADLPLGVDISAEQMADIGWRSDGDGVPDGRDACLDSDRRETVVVGSCDSGAPNLMLFNGCKVSDRVAACAAGAKNHGEFGSCVSSLGYSLRAVGLYTGAQYGALRSCAARAGH